MLKAIADDQQNSNAVSFFKLVQPVGLDTTVDALFEIKPACRWLWERGAWSTRSW